MTFSSPVFVQSSLSTGASVHVFSIMYASIYLCGINQLKRIYMSSINTNATVTLTVNGKQAQDMLDNLKRKSQDLERAIDKAARTGNKVELKSRLTARLHKLKVQLSVWRRY